MNTSSPPSFASKWLRLGALALGAGLLALGSALAYLLLTFDADHHESLAVAWMRDHWQRTLTIEGPVELQVFPRPKLIVSRLTLSEPGSPEEFARAEEVALGLQLLPLLRQQLKVDRIEARGLRVSYIRDAQGRSNIDDLLQPLPASSTRLRFDVQRLDLEDLRIAVNDAFSRVRGDLIFPTLSTGRLADRLPTPVSLDVQAALLSPSLIGQVQGQAELRFDLTQGRLALSDSALRYRGSALGVQDIDLRLGGHLAYTASTGALEAERLQIDATAALGPLRFDSARLSVHRFGFEPQRKALTLDRLDVRLKGSRDRQPFELRLEWPQLAVAGQSIQGSAVEGELTVGSTQAVRARFRSETPGGHFDLLQLPGVSARLTSEGAPRQLAGEVRTDLSLQPARAAVALHRLDARIQVRDPSIKPLALAFQGEIEATGRSVQWQLDGTLNDDQRFSTQGDATFAGDAPQVKAQGRFDVLDLDHLLADPPPAAVAPAASGSLAAHVPVDLSVLRTLQGSFSLSAGALVYHRVRLDEAQLEAQLEGGMLRVPRFAGRVWDGRIEASAFADARARRVTLKATASDIDIGQATQDLGRPGLIEGRGRLSVDLDTAGLHLGEMAARLSGKASLQLRNGELMGADLPRALREARPLLAAGKTPPQRLPTGSTSFSDLKAGFTLVDGVASSSDFEARGPQLRLAGEGRLDLARGRLDGTLRGTVAPQTRHADSDDLSALRGLVLPVRLEGPLQAISWQAQWPAADLPADAAPKNRTDKPTKESTP